MELPRSINTDNLWFDLFCEFDADPELDGEEAGRLAQVAVEAVLNEWAAIQAQS